MRLRFRIAAILAALLALNALFVLALLWAYGVLVPTVVGGAVVFAHTGTFPVDLLRLPVSWPTYLALVGVFLAAQVYYGYERVLAGTRAPDGEAEHEIAELVRRLAMAADVPAPAVHVVEDETPSCYTVGRLTDATVVVTTGLIERLDADELEGVLAHEIAHVRNRDVTLMTITTLFLEVADRAYGAARLARRAITNPGGRDPEERLTLTWFLPLVLVTYVFVAPVLALFPPIADRATRTLSHAREYAADAAAARLTGKPLALATALVALSPATPTPETDLRTSRTRALCILPGNPVTGGEADSLPTVEPADDAANRRDRLRAWIEGATPAQSEGASTARATHPSVATRVRRLQDVAADLEGAR